MKKIWFGVFVAVFAFSAHAEIKVAIAQGYINLAPYIVDDYKAAYELAGIEATFEVMPGARALAMAADGTYQALDARFKGTSMVANLIPVDVPIYLLSKTYAFSNDSSLSFSTLEDLKGIKIAGARDSAFNNDLKMQGYDINMVADETTALKMVESGRAQVALTSDFAFSQLQALGVGEGFQAVSAVLSEQWLYHHVHKDHADLVPKLEAAIRQLQEEQGLFKLR